jgi:hypothetical protein
MLLGQEGDAPATAGAAAALLVGLPFYGYDYVSDVQTSRRLDVQAATGAGGCRVTDGGGRD